MKRIIKYVLILFLVPPIGVIGQNYFNKVYDYQNHVEGFSNILITPDSNYLAAGDFFSTLFRGFYFAKTNTLGDTLWTKAYKKDSIEYFSGFSGALINTLDSGFVLCGAVSGMTTYQPHGFIMKLKSNGDTSWTKTISSSYTEAFLNCLQNSDGTFVFAGWSEAFSSGNNSDMWLVKTDSVGNVLWQKHYGGSGMELTYSLAKSTDGGYVLAGYTNSFGAGSYDAYVVKTDSAGNFQWQKTLGFANSDVAAGIIQTADGGYLVSGVISINASNTNSNCYLAKISASGSLIWQKNYYGVSYNEFDSKAIELSNGNFLAVGLKVDTVSNHVLGYVMEVCSNGDSIWGRTYSKWNSDNYFKDIEAVNGGGFIIAGYAMNTLNIDGNEDGWLIKIDSLGCDSTGCLPSNVSCPITGIQESTHQNNSCKIFPNPNNGTMQFDYNLEAGESGQLFLYDLTGKIIQSWILQPGQGTMPIDEANLNNGIYFYRYIVDGEAVNSDKIIIIK